MRVRKDQWWLWDTETWEHKGTLTDYTGAVADIVFTPDGKVLASGSWDKTVRLWDLVTGKSKGTLTGHTDLVTRISLSPDGKVLASGSWDKTVRLWDAVTGESKGTLTGGPDLSYIVFSLDGRTIVGISSDDTLLL